MLNCANARELEDQGLADETQDQVVEGCAHAILGKIAEVDGGPARMMRQILVAFNAVVVRQTLVC